MSFYMTIPLPNYSCVPCVALHVFQEQKSNLCFVEQKRRLQLRVNVSHDGLNPVVGGSSVENEKPEFGLALPLVHEHGALDVGLVPLVVDVLVQCNLVGKEDLNHAINMEEHPEKLTKS